MSRFKFLDKMILLEKLVRQGKTGTPDELTKRLSVSRSTMHRMIDEMNILDAKVVYCRARKSYCYDGDKVVEIYIKTKPLTEKEEKK